MFESLSRSSFFYEFWFRFFITINREFGVKAK